MSLFKHRMTESQIAQQLFDLTLIRMRPTQKSEDRMNEMEIPEEYRDAYTEELSASIVHLTLDVCSSVYGEKGAAINKLYLNLIQKSPIGLLAEKSAEYSRLYVKEALRLSLQGSELEPTNFLSKHVLLRTFGQREKVHLLAVMVTSAILRGYILGVNSLLRDYKVS